MGKSLLSSFEALRESLNLTLRIDAPRKYLGNAWNSTLTLIMKKPAVPFDFILVVNDIR